MLSVIGFAACIYFKVPVTLVYDSFLGIITATILWSVTVAVIVYVMARKQKTGLAPGGKTGTVCEVLASHLAHCYKYMYNLFYKGYHLYRP